MKKAAIRAMIVLAAVVALSMFFSGTIRTMTTPKVRFASARNGKFERTMDMTGKIFFPEEEEVLLTLPEGTSLTVSSVRVQPGDKIREGDPLFSATLVDLEKNLETLQKEYDDAQTALRTQIRKHGEIRLSRNEKVWLDAYDASVAADAKQRDCRLEMLALLSQEGLSMEGDTPPEEASEDLKKACEAWLEARKASGEASARLTSLDRFAIAEEVWEDLSTRREQQAKMENAEKQMAELTVLSRKVREYPAPHGGYVTAVSAERGSRLENGAVLVKMTPEEASPVIRTDISQFWQSVAKGTAVSVVQDEWNTLPTKVAATGVASDASRYADITLTDEIVRAYASVRNLMKNEIKLRVTTRAQEATCLIPAAAVRGSDKDRYVFVTETESSTLGGTQTKVRKTTITVLNESDTTVSAAEDLTYQKIAYQEDRPINEGDTVMGYTDGSGEGR